MKKQCFPWSSGRFVLSIFEGGLCYWECSVMLLMCVEMFISARIIKLELVHNSPFTEILYKQRLVQARERFLHSSLYAHRDNTYIKICYKVHWRASTRDFGLAEVLLSLPFLLFILIKGHTVSSIWTLTGQHHALLSRRTWPYSIFLSLCSHTLQPFHQTFQCLYLFRSRKINEFMIHKKQ